VLISSLITHSILGLIWIRMRDDGLAFPATNTGSKQINVSIGPLVQTAAAHLGL